MRFGILVFGIKIGILVLITIVRSFPKDFEDRIGREFPSSFGRIWSFYGFEIDKPNKWNYEVKDSSFCQCRSLCFTMNCSTLSMRFLFESEFKVGCRLYFLPLHNLSLHQVNNSVTEARESSFQFYHDRGVFYDIPAPESSKTDVVQAQRICEERYRNGRLPILKTWRRYNSYWKFREMKRFTKEGDCSFLDLSRNKSTEKFFWSDGTLFEDTELHNRFKFENDTSSGDHTAACGGMRMERTIVNIFEGQPGITLCQIDPFKEN